LVPDAREANAFASVVNSGTAPPSDIFRVNQSLFSGPSSHRA
jgi:hypothetical protein